MVRVGIVTYGHVLSTHGGMGVRARGVIEDIVRSGAGAELNVLSIGEGASGNITVDGHSIPVSGLSPWFHGWSRHVYKAVSHLVRTHEVVIVESAALLPVVMLARTLARRRDLRIVWDTNDCETYHYSQLPRTAKNNVQGKVWWVLEWFGTTYADCIVALSDTHAKLWQGLFPRCADRLAVVDFHPVGSAAPSVGAEPASADLDLPQLVFVGAMAAKHNLSAANWLIKEMAPRLSKPARLVFVGPGSEALPDQPPSGPAEVQRLGEVSDLAAPLSRAALCLAPLLSSAGPKTKVLDYVAAGARVVGTPVAYEGLEGCPGFVVSTLDDFPATIERLLSTTEGPEETAERRAAQAQWLSRRHGAEVTAGQWRAVLDRLGVTR